MAQELADLIRQYEKIFSDIPSRTNVAYHDVDIGDARPVKQPPYRISPIKARQARAAGALLVYWYLNQMGVTDYAQITER